MLDAGDAQWLCRSCRLNLTIPQLTVTGHVERWATVEQAKRRLLYTLMGLGLTLKGKQDEGDTLGLGFRILTPIDALEPVLTGHGDGVITLNLQEADDVHREMTRVAIGEPWRTLLGHLRHEAAHYLHHRWILGDSEAQDQWRQAFGDERTDYGPALDRYHQQGPVPGWEASHVSPYANALPHEDWAETCAHLLLVIDAVETAAARGLHRDSRAAHADPASHRVPGLPTEELLVTQWLPVAQFLNAMNRSLGLKDSYPFLLPEAVVQKMTVAACLLQRAAAQAA